MNLDSVSVIVIQIGMNLESGKNMRETVSDKSQIWS
jgi:hypothetical protein